MIHHLAEDSTTGERAGGVLAFIVVLALLVAIVVVVAWFGGRLARIPDSYAVGAGVLAAVLVVLAYIFHSWIPFIGAAVIGALLMLRAFSDGAGNDWESG